MTTNNKETNDISMIENDILTFYNIIFSEKKFISFFIPL